MLFLSFCKSSLLGEGDLLTFGEFCFTMIWRADIDVTKDVEILVSLKYLRNFWRTSGIKFMLTWFTNYFLVADTAANQVPTFAKADTEIYVPILTLLTGNNENCLHN